MKKFINSATMLAFLLTSFLISQDTYAAHYGKKSKSNLHSQKVTQRIEKQNKKRQGKKTSFRAKESISIDLPAEFDWKMFLLMSMMLAHDINTNYYDKIISSNSTINIPSILKCNDVENSLIVDDISIKNDIDLSPKNEIFDDTQVDISRILLGIDEKKITKNKLSLKNNKCTFDALTNKPSAQKRNIEESEKQENVNPFVPNYKKIIGADIAHINGCKGEDINVLIMDTSIDKRSLINAQNVKLTYIDNDLYKENKFISHPHGTHVTGIIQTMAPDSTLISAGIDEGNCLNDFIFANKISTILQQNGNHLDVINYSVGLDSMNHEALIDEFKLLTNNDIVIFIAFGNDWHKPYEAHYHQDLLDFVNREEFNGLVRIVGNLEYFGKKSLESLHYSSNRCSPEQDCKYLIFAPGTNICSTLPNNEVGLKTGTSMATPIVVGAYALLKGAYPDKSAIEILDLMDESARKVNLDGKILGPEYGVGIIDVENAFNLAEQKGWYIKKSWFKKIVESNFFQKCTQFLLQGPDIFGVSI